MSERGSVSVVLAVVVGFAMLLALFALDIASALVARSRAQAAADAAALAAAAELAVPSGRTPLDAAAEYAGRGGARLIECACSPGSQEAIVTVEVPVRLVVVPGGSRSVRMSARAVVDWSGGSNGPMASSGSPGSARAARPAVRGPPRL